MSRSVNPEEESICAGCMRILMSGLNISRRLSNIVPLQENLIARKSSKKAKRAYDIPKPCSLSTSVVTS